LEPFDLLMVTGGTVVATRSGAVADAIKDVNTVASGPIVGRRGGPIVCGSRFCKKSLESIQSEIYLQYGGCDYWINYSLHEDGDFNLNNAEWYMGVLSVSKAVRFRNSEYDLKDLYHLLGLAAALVDADPNYAPIFERVEAEIATYEARAALTSRARDAAVRYGPAQSAAS
jgi:hypothetical protein